MAATLTKPIIIWTRSIADWSQDSTFFDRHLNLVHHIPAIRHVPSTLPPSSIPESVGLAIVTSSYVASQDIINPWKIHLKGIPIYCVGEKTARAMRSYNLSATHPDHVASASDLAQWLDKNHPGVTALFLGADQPAFDWLSWAASSGRPFHWQSVYQVKKGITTSSGKPLTAEEKEALRRLDSGVVCFASPSAVEGFCADLWQEAFFSQNPCDPSFGALPTNLTAIAIGSTTGSQCKGRFPVVHVLPKPDVAYLARKAIEVLALC